MKIHLAFEQGYGYVALRTACGVCVRGPVSSNRALVTCAACRRIPPPWRAIEGYHYKRAVDPRRVPQGRQHNDSKPEGEPPA